MLKRHAIRASCGATLIEVVITFAIIALLVVLGLPGLTEWIQNAQVRTAADGVLSGLQYARTEAVRRNARVAFALTDAGATGGTGWNVTLVNTGAVVQSKTSGEGSRNAVLTVTPADTTTVTFNGLGRVGTNTDGSSPITLIDVDVGAGRLSAERSRELRITISTGGEVRMCDPSVTNPTDTRAC